MVILFDRYNFPENIYEIVFATEQQAIVAEILIEQMKNNSNSFNKTEMSYFATKLHEGEMTVTIRHGSLAGKTVKISYNKRQFYDRILTPMKGMGLVDYDLYKKTYTTSDKFKQSLMKIGMMWSEELQKPSFSIRKEGASR
jgi:hypothetical protein